MAALLQEDHRKAPGPAISVDDMMLTLFGQSAFPS